MLSLKLISTNIINLRKVTCGGKFHAPTVLNSISCSPLTFHVRTFANDSVVKLKKKKKHGQIKNTNLDVPGVQQQTSVAVYVGERKGDMYHGQGRLVTPTGIIYEGQWSNGYQHGPGKMILPNGTTLVGEFKYGELARGTITNDSGVVTEGQWMERKLIGRGKKTYADGAVLEGEFQDGVIINGAGVFRNNRGLTFIGVWVDGKLTGPQCKIVYPDGTSVEGEFRKGEIYNGTGVFSNKDGETSSGVWINGKLHGPGCKILHADGSCSAGEFVDGNIVNGSGIQRIQTAGAQKTLSGTWVNGKLHGPHCKIVYPGGGSAEGEFREGKIFSGVKTPKRITGDTFCGIFVDGKLHGPHCQLTKSTGIVYDGEFKENVWISGSITDKHGTVVFTKHWEGDRFVATQLARAESSVYHVRNRLSGQGKLTYQDGSVLEGEWKEGKLHGRGKILFPNGALLEGEFKEGNLYNGTGTQRAENGDFTSVQWVEGKLHDPPLCEIAVPKSIAYEEEDFGAAQYTTATAEEGQEEAESSIVESGNNIMGVKLTQDWRVLEGKFSLGRLHGRGKITHPGGAVLEGIFKEGKIFKGEGEFIDPEGVSYSGVWELGALHGPQCKIVYPDGTFKEGRFAKGKLFTSSVVDVSMNSAGAFYCGTWEEGKLHGPDCKITSADGKVVRGEFRGGKVWNGQGEWQEEDGTVLCGVWVEGILQGAAQRYA